MSIIYLLERAIKRAEEAGEAEWIDSIYISSDAATKILNVLKAASKAVLAEGMDGIPLEEAHELESALSALDLLGDDHD